MSSAEDAEQFRAAMRGVKPLATTGRAPRARKIPQARALQTEADEAAVLAELLSGPDPESVDTGDSLRYAAQGVQDRVLRQLRRGNFRREAELDLHGLNKEQARLEVARFITHCLDQDWRCVRIIHGKGNRSPNSGPVLKRELDGWLRKIRAVLAYCSARPEDGGTGAIYVLLRRKG